MIFEKKRWVKELIKKYNILIKGGQGDITHINELFKT